MTDPRPKCSYWDTCYRKNPTHLAQFRHPADDVAAAATTPTAAPLDAPKPKLKTVARAASVQAKLTKMADSNGTTSINGDSSNASTNDDAKSDAPHGKKRTRDESVTATSPASSSSSSTSAQDAHFHLDDKDWDASTLDLWRQFHSGCWSTSCSVHSTPSARDAFFPIASALLKSLYGGMEFASDLFQLFEFAWELHHQLGGTKVDIGEYKDADIADTESKFTIDTSSGIIESNSSCSWSIDSNNLLHVFAPFLHISLVGPFKILCGHFRSVNPQKLHPFLLDRFFYDSPEVWAVMQQLPSHHTASSSSSSVSSSSSSSSSSAIASDPAVHWCYYRDDPSQPATFIGRLSELSPAITLTGPNLLATLLVIIDDEMDEVGGAQSAAKKQKLDPTQTTIAIGSTASPTTYPVTLESMRESLVEFASARGYTLTGKGGKRLPPKRDSAWMKREKKVVCDLENKVGLVVPYKDDIGWRPVNAEREELIKIVADIEKAKYSGRKINFDALDHLVTLTQYANDELDPGMGIQLALELLAMSRTNAINSDICRLLSMGYSLVDRPIYSAVIELHMRHRSKHLRQLGKGKFARAPPA